MTDIARDDWDTWCQQRLDGVRAVPGNLALIAYQSVGADDVAVECLDGLSVRRVGDQAGVTFTVDRTVEYCGEPVGPGEFVAERTGPTTPNYVRIDRYWIDAFSLDGSDYELRIYDTEAPRISEFDTIEVYDFDPAMVVPGTFDEFDSTDKVPWQFTRAEDSGHTKQVPGKIKLEMGGESVELLGFLDGPNLVVVFADGTTGAESYAPGRFLLVPSPADDGSVTVDFNRAFVPPCGFSDFYSCPIPPAENRIATPVRAGERRVRWHSGPS